MTSTDFSNEDFDCVLNKLLELGIPLTQQNYLQLAYLGCDLTIEDLDAEQLAELPENFELWPRTEMDIH